MRFKAKLSPEHVELLHNLISPISRLNPSSPYSDIGGGTTMLYLDDHKLLLSTQGRAAESRTITTNVNSSSGNNHNISGYSYSNRNDASNVANTTSTNNTSSNDAEGIFCFAEMITTNGIFQTHRIESLEPDNAILMEVCLTQFRTALRGVFHKKGGKQHYAAAAVAAGGSGSGMTASLYDDPNNANHNTTQKMNGDEYMNYEVTMKLAKRNGGLPHLCLDSKAIGSGGNGSGGGGLIDVHHAIPVRIRKVEELRYHVPPRMGMPDVQLELPKANHRPLKTVVERLRSISPHVYIEGSMSGILTLRIDGDGASIRTTYNKLIPIHEDTKSSQRQDEEDGDDEGDGGVGGGDGIDRDGDATMTNSSNSESIPKPQSQRKPSQSQAPAPAKCTLKLDIKKLHASLHWQGSLGYRDVSSAILCMWENEMLVLDVTLNPEVGRFMYYIPVHYISDEWD